MIKRYWIFKKEGDLKATLNAETQNRLLAANWVHVGEEFAESSEEAKARFEERPLEVYTTPVKKENHASANGFVSAFKMAVNLIASVGFIGLLIFVFTNAGDNPQLTIIGGFSGVLTLTLTLGLSYCGIAIADNTKRNNELLAELIKSQGNK